MDMHEYHLGFLNKAVQLSVEKEIDVETALKMLLQEDESSQNDVTEKSTIKKPKMDKLQKHLTPLNAVFSALVLSNWF